jgi:hypothetical protein
MEQYLLAGFKYRQCQTIPKGEKEIPIYANSKLPPPARVNHSMGGILDISICTWEQVQCAPMSGSILHLHQLHHYIFSQL